MSRTGRERRQQQILRIAAAATVVAAVAWGGVEIARTVRDDRGRGRLAAAEPDAPLKAIALTTDGVLTRAWVERTLALPKSAGLMSMDLYALRAKLLASGQVAAAVLTRNFPSTLGVSLQERSPVARVMAQLGDEPPQPLLVARDGAVYAGENYDRAMLATLPWLDGVKLARAGGGLAPIDGMETVADFLATARNQAEPLYRTFVVVSLARLASDEEIVVRSRDIAAITFSTRDDFFRQLARLDYVLDLARTQPDKPVDAVNLADGLQVPVAFGDTARLKAPTSASVRPAAAAPGRGLLFFPQLNHTSQRDF
jgi:cell division protein FtsQ